MILSKNLLRAFVGFASSIIPYQSDINKRIYINLRGLNQIGGPDRFLRNLSLIIQDKNIQITNWTLNRCDAALVFSASWGDSFTWLCRTVGVRSVLRVDGYYVPEIYGPTKKKPLIENQRRVNEQLRTDLEKFDHIIYQSVFSKEQADLHLFHRTKAYSIIHNGVNTQFFKPPIVTMPKKASTIIVLGKHYPEHLSLALDVFLRVRATKDVKLLIVGPMRDGTERVAQFVAEYLKGSTLTKHIDCLGTISYEKLPDILSQGNIFLHVKVGDWCPNAVAEAMACGLPIVCPAWGGTKELIKEGGIAVEGPPWNIDDKLRDGMAEAVLQVLRNLDNYSSSALAIAKKHYDIRFIAEKYLKALEVDV